jgi:hypothetical protein
MNFGRRLAVWSLTITGSILLYWMTGFLGYFILPVLGIPVFFLGRKRHD